MGVLDEGHLSEEEETEIDEQSPGPKSMTALSLLESLAEKAAEATAKRDVEEVVGADNDDNDDNESLASSQNSSDGLPIQDDVFELEELEEVSGHMEALSLGEAGH
ncbi:unnamed protein product [Sphacelaria rigidula]